MARVLVLRQAPEAFQTAETVRARGHEPILLPLGETVPLSVPPPPGRVSGFVVTSLQGVGALAAAFPCDQRPVLSVGARTRDALLAAGFENVEAGPGSAVDLVPRAAAIARQGAGAPLLYPAGRVRTAAFERDAAAAGVPLAVWEVYDLVARRPSDLELADAFSGEGPSDALILSAGQAEGFTALWDRIRGAGRIPPELLCLSRRISGALRAELRPFARISPQPRLSSLFDRFLPPSLEQACLR